MTRDEMLKATFHVEILVTGDNLTEQKLKEIEEAVVERLHENYNAVRVGQAVDGFDGILHEPNFAGVEIIDYIGPINSTGIYSLHGVELRAQAYRLKELESLRTIRQVGVEDYSQTRILALPSAALHNEWASLVFDDALPARLLRYLVRMASMMSQPGLNMRTFNWNRLCLLHGPPGSGKSTLCRALAQKLSIRLSGSFPESSLVEVNANAMLSKFFGESGKIINATFDGVVAMAQNRKCLVCVVIDEVETIAGSRERIASGNECQDGLRATNQLLTALDRLRDLANVLVLCTSNLIEAIDPAFVDRVDIKQMIPSPSPAAIYNIFRSCLNELVRSSIVEASAVQASPLSVQPDVSSASRSRNTSSSSRKPVTRSSKAKQPFTEKSPSPEPWTMLSAPTIPTFSEMKVREATDPDSPGCRVWSLAQKCKGFSGRTLRRLPILGLAMYTWGGNCSLHDAVSALEAAVHQELLAMTND